MAKALQARCNETRQVKEILAGEGFKNTNPRYVSRPDIVGAEVQHQATHLGYNGQDKLYGKQQNLRHLDPGMSEIMAWGENDPPVKNDFTSDKHAFTYQRKINQLGVNFISEAQDKFRAHDNKPVVDQIINYTQG